MARVFFALTVFAAVAAIALSFPNNGNELEPEILENQQVGLPTDELLKALEMQYYDEGEAVGRGANLFNLSAYLATRPAGNVTQLTFIPLITLLTATLG